MENPDFRGYYKVDSQGALEIAQDMYDDGHTFHAIQYLENTFNMDTQTAQNILLGMYDTYVDENDTLIVEGPSL